MNAFTKPKLNDQRRALGDLRDCIKVALTCDFLKETTPEEHESFKQKHPGAHFVIGDFEIKCLNPEKYGL